MNMRGYTPGVALINMVMLFTCQAGPVHSISNNNPRQDLLSAEERLIRKLLQNYEPSVRPRRLATETVLVNVSITFFQIDSVVSQDQQMRAKWFVQMEWYDDYLRWAPVQNEGVTSLVLGTNNIWVPGLALKNSVDGFMHKTLLLYQRARVFWTGRVEWEPGQTFTTSCPLQMELYPFDTQTCQLNITTWVYTRRQVELLAVEQNPDTVRGEGMVDGEWLVQGMMIRNELYHYPTVSSENDSYPQVVAEITLRRRSLYYIINLLVPCFTQTGLLLLVFYLPADGQRLGLAVGLLLAFSFLQVTLADSIPHTSLTVPFLVIYVTYLMVLTSLTIAATVLILHLHNRHLDDKPPYWLHHMVCDTMSCGVCLHRGRKLKSFASRSTTYEINMQEKDIYTISASCGGGLNANEPNSSRSESINVVPVYTPTNTKPHTVRYNAAYEPDMDGFAPRSSLKSLRIPQKDRDSCSHGKSRLNNPTLQNINNEQGRKLPESTQFTLHKYSGRQSHDPNSHDSTSHDSHKHDSTSHDSTSHDSTSHDSTSHHSTSHDVISYGSHSHDPSSVIVNKSIEQDKGQRSKRDRRRFRKQHARHKKTTEATQSMEYHENELNAFNQTSTRHSYRHLDAALEYLHFQGRKLLDKPSGEPGGGSAEWRHLAAAVDKILFRVFLALAVIPFVGIVIGIYTMFG